MKDDDEQPAPRSGFIENKEKEGNENNIENEKRNSDKKADDENEKDNQNKENKMKEEKESGKDEEKEPKEEPKKEKERSKFSLEGAKQPLSIYTRRVMDASKINEYLKPNSSRGQIGGINLGNTCFMNSSIACLSNCTELTYYFLKGDYLKDINEENNLGMRGQLAKEWGKLMDQYWVQDTSTGDPSDFKRTIGQKAVRFKGYGQQDSNEFMSIFLDYLNEDLNKTTKKEYIELKEKADNETDQQCAKRFWEANLRRNDSIITDLFCGQFKSTITCPKCSWINITFDPFDTLNLPLLTQPKRSGYGFGYGNAVVDLLKFYYVPKNVFRNTYCLKIKEVSKAEMTQDLINRIKKEEDFIYHDKINALLMVDMYRKKKYGYVDKNVSLRNYTLEDEYLYSFDYDKKVDEIIFPLYFWEKDDQDSQSVYPRLIFCNGEENLYDLKKKVYFFLRKYILSPFLKENEEKDRISIEIEKYIEDKKLELPDEEIYKIVEKEYEDIFIKYNNDDEESEEKKEKKNDEENKDDNIEMKSEEEKEKKEKEEQKNKTNNKETNPQEFEEYKKCIENFKSDIPFKIIIRKEGFSSYYNKEIPFITSENFTSFNKNLKEYLSIKKLSAPFKDMYSPSNKYEIIVKFKPGSKYINKSTFDLNLYDNIQFDYKPKKKEPKKEEEKEEEDDGKMTLEKCLKKFCKEEQLEEGDEWYCSKCKNHVLAKKKMELYYVPKILIICFKRFVKHSYGWEKNDDEVEFPINNMDLKNFVIGPDKEHSKYDLFAVSQHYGSTGGGHYTALCKNDGKWFDYNDSSCRVGNEREAQTSAAYVLFYRRQTD